MKALNGPKCIGCESIFHPKCASRLKLQSVDEHSVNGCGKAEMSGEHIEVNLCNLPLSPAADISSGDYLSRGNEVIAYLQSADHFSNRIARIVENQTVALRNEVAALRNDLYILGTTNIDLIKLLSEGGRQPPRTHGKRLPILCQLA